MRSLPSSTRRALSFVWAPRDGLAWRVAERDLATPSGYHRLVAGDALIDEIANELDTWPGVRIERRDDGAAVAVYDEIELGVLDAARAVVELRFPGPEHDDLVEHGDALPESDVVSHGVRGPSDVTAALELFDRRYRDVRGEDDPYSSDDPA